MKIQDAVFLIILIFLLLKQNTKWLTIAGIFLLIVSIPLFTFWVFFTAERLTWYAGAFFLAAIIIHFVREKNNL